MPDSALIDAKGAPFVLLRLQWQWASQGSIGLNEGVDPVFGFV